MSEWQLIKTAPRDRFVLLYVPSEQLEIGPNGVTMGIYFPAECEEELRDHRGRFKKRHPWWPADLCGWLGNDGDNGASWCEPTHWMPLPSPPLRSEDRDEA